MREQGRIAAVTQPDDLVSLEQAKSYLRYSGDAEDVTIRLLLGAAVEEAETKLLNRYLMPRTVDVYLHGWPDSLVLPLPRPLRAVTWVKYFDPSGVEHTLPAENYEVSTVGLTPALVVRGWPGVTLRDADGLVVRCEVGYANVGAVPLRYTLLILALVAIDYSNRDALAADSARQRENVALRLLGERAE